MMEKYRETPKGRIALNGYRLCDPLPEGQILTDTEKKQWVIGKTIGLGGFGEIYLIHEKNSPSIEYVMKLDNQNGPLFVEVNFVLRACQKSAIAAFMEKHNLTFLGIPRFIASGTHQTSKSSYRFLIMERLGEELQKVLETKRLKISTTCRIASRIIDVLEYIHDRGYIHADIKAQNILKVLNANKIADINTNGSSSRSKNKKRAAIDSSNSVDDDDENDHYYLIDYGLVEKYTLQGVHKPYGFDKRKANNGTCEFRSRDAHIGVISRRSDIESLGFNLILWFYGRHPWENVLKDAEKVLEKKNWAMRNIKEFLKEAFNNKPLRSGSSCDESKSSKSSTPIKSKTPSANVMIPKRSNFINCTPPKGLGQFFEEINNLEYDARPNYAMYKKILNDIANLNKNHEFKEENPKKTRLSDVDELKSVRMTRKESAKKLNSIKNISTFDDMIGEKDFNDTNDDTEIEDFVDSTALTNPSTKSTASRSTINVMKRGSRSTTHKKENILSNNNNNNRTNRSKNKKISQNDSSAEENSFTKTPPVIKNIRLNRASRYSTPLMMLTPPESADNPLFGPFEPDESINQENNVVGKIDSNARVRNLRGRSDKKNPESAIDRRFRSCRIYINNKRCRPRQSYDEDDLNGFGNALPDQDYSSILSSSIESLTFDNDRSHDSLMHNGKSQSSNTKPKKISTKKNPSKIMKTNGTINTSKDRKNALSKTNGTKHSGRDVLPIAIKSGISMNSGVPETAAMQRIREMIQNKKKQTK
ncbi:uncharacterized protein NH340_JMT07303 [Sarcoptes scabiei]|uniref:Serine/threonine-protein kinase VRK1-like protein n=1 Tax=Sarcoptes scabiei TaxID=52283 RepID=A0A131ZTS5_SARSC|nr:serine/threonine-protein kinase VRK1-like protein [Sarcoptes scabiei]UXI21360.1 uncharacterized protein NH340_JMT07303 [Sarcoptes scabiei]